MTQIEKVKQGRPTFLPILMILGLCVFLITGTPMECLAKKNVINVTIIKDPKPTCVEKEYSDLVKVGEVVEDENDKEFLVFPRSLVVDDDGNVYAYDAMMAKVYKYDKHLRLQTTFGGRGVGPGEFGTFSRLGRGNIHLYVGQDKHIYAGDRRNRKIVCFDANGHMIKEIRMEVSPFSYIKPVLDEKGNFFLHSSNGGIIDIYSPEGKLKQTLLDEKYLPYGMFYRLKRKLNFDFYILNDPESIFHERLKDGRLLVFHSHSGFLYVVKDGKLVHKVALWPKNILEKYRVKLDETINVDDLKYEGFFTFFHRLFVDGDDGKTFYLFFIRLRGDGHAHIYHFTPEGKLLKVFRMKAPNINGYAQVHFKKHGLFYVVGKNKEGNNTIYTYKEERKK